MSLRKFMHPRNKYKVEPNFKDLADVYPEFRQHLITDLSGKLKFNFKNPASLRALTQLLLKHDFDLTVKIPDEKLVPALPLRLNYILWIEDLVKHATLQDVRGLDIGTGAIAIYPLLCSKTLNWKMVGTEIDDVSLNSALETIKQNNLQNSIQIFPAKSDNIFDESVTRESFDFSMCNPPFFDDNANDRKPKKTAPRNAATGSGPELQTSGGERSFILKMVEESSALRDKIRIYTTMIGHKSTLGIIKSALAKNKIQNFTWTEFCQGHTKRWGLAWSFLPPEHIDLRTAPVIRARNETKSEEFALELEFPTTVHFSGVPVVVEKLRQWAGELNMELEELNLEDEELDVWTCQLRAHEDSWTHARRKRRLALRQGQEEGKKPRIDQQAVPHPQNSGSQFENCAEGLEDHHSNDAGATPKRPVDQNSDVEPENSAEGFARRWNSGLDPEKSSRSDVKSAKPPEPYLECTLAVGELGEHDNDLRTEDTRTSKLKISLIFQGGCGGKNALETFRQFLINKFNIREYFQLQSKSKSPRKRRKKRKNSAEQQNQ